MNILAIDDNSDNLLALKAFLKTYLPEAALSTALSGREGIDLARTLSLDVILLDIQMPGMDGYETARLLKQDPLTAAIPIVMLTAQRTDNTSKARALDAGADAFLAKPLDEAELVAQVKAMVRIKRSEDALRRERDSLEQQVAARMREVYEKQRLNQLLLDAIPHHAYLVDRDRHIISMNAVASRAGGANGDYCWCAIRAMAAITAGQKEHFLTHGAPLPGTRCRDCWADEALEHQTAFSETIEEGGMHWEIWWIPVDRKVLLHYLMDITERVRSEEELRKMEEQLQHAQRMESMGNLAGGVAHDFNNILTVVSGYAYMIQTEFKEQQHLCDMARMISTSADRGTNLTRSLLAFSRKQAIELNRHDLAALVAELRKTLQRLIREDIQLHIETGDVKLPVMVDQIQIDQVIINLVVNARDAMPDGGCITIVISQLAVDDSEMGQYGIGTPGTYARLSVCDNGHGMDAATAQQIFEPFFTTKKRGHGTGLGLAIAYGIMKKHNGHITVASEPGKGTTFDLYLPLASYPLPENRADTATRSLPSLRGTVLLVEDEDAVRVLITKLLEKIGCTVVSTGDGQSGLATFERMKDQIDLVLSDVVMPNMKGGDMCIAIRSLSPTVPIILMSGYSEGTISDETCTRYGFKFLMKPVRPDRLFATMQELLNQQPD